MRVLAGETDDAQLHRRSEKQRSKETFTALLENSGIVGERDSVHQYEEKRFLSDTLPSPDKERLEDYYYNNVLYKEGAVSRISKEGETKSYIAAITYRQSRNNNRGESANLYVVDKNNNCAKSVMNILFPKYDGYLKVNSMEENNGVLTIEYEGVEYEYRGIDQSNRKRIRETKTFTPEDFIDKKDSQVL